MSGDRLHVEMQLNIADQTQSSDDLNDLLEGFSGRVPTMAQSDKVKEFLEKEWEKAEREVRHLVLNAG